MVLNALNNIFSKLISEITELAALVILFCIGALFFIIPAYIIYYCYKVMNANLQLMHSETRVCNTAADINEGYFKKHYQK